MTGIFINYRRADSGEYAKKIFRHLANHFGTENVFIDKEGIDPGEDVRHKIEETIKDCDFMIVIIGNQWLTLTDNTGRKRLSHPTDFVRWEIETALNYHVRLLPVLVDGAAMPKRLELGEATKPVPHHNLHSLLRFTGISDLNAIAISSKTLKRDVDKLINKIEKTYEQLKQKGEEIIGAVQTVLNEGKSCSMGRFSLNLTEDDYLVLEAFIHISDLEKNLSRILSAGLTIFPRGKSAYGGILKRAWNMQEYEDVSLVAQQIIVINQAVGIHYVENLKIVTEAKTPH